MDNRALLLRCALELIAQRGYDGVGVQEIVDAAGVTKPTLYHYFGSKLGVLQALLDDHSGRLNRAVQEAAAYSHDLTLTLTRVVKAFFTFAKQDPTYYRMQLALWFAPTQSDAFKVVSAFNEQQYKIVERLFAEATEDHGNMRGRQQAYATTFIGLINTYVGLWLNGYTMLDDELVYRAVHQFEHGIYS
jgi:AcrR family transcriptional regulator